MVCYYMDLVVLLVVLLSTGGIMVVPDAAVYAALPLLGGVAVWVGKQFVSSVKLGTGTPPDEMSVKVYRQLAHMFRSELESHFDNRYMFADEARQRFTDLEQKLDNKFSEMKDLVRQSKV
jgi:hypothetical protein